MRELAQFINWEEVYKERWEKERRAAVLDHFVDNPRELVALTSLFGANTIISRATELGATLITAGTFASYPDLAKKCGLFCYVCLPMVLRPLTALATEKFFRVKIPGAVAASFLPICSVFVNM